MGELAETFRQSIANYSDAHIIFTDDAARAVDYITNIIQETKTS
ncbi:hypothetical protein ACFLVK_01490 [Chloroflexota bacterium]